MLQAACSKYFPASNCLADEEVDTGTVALTFDYKAQAMLKEEFSLCDIMDCPLQPGRHTMHFSTGLPAMPAVSTPLAAAAAVVLHC